MQDLLFLAHRIPFPPDKGDKIRSWHLLRHLAKRYRVHLGAFIDTPEDARHVPILQVLCATTHFAMLDPRRARLRAARGFLSGEALSFPYYRHTGMREWVERTVAAHAPAAGLAFSSQVAPYLIAAARPGMRTVIDFVDVDSDKWAQYAARQRFPWSWVYGREGRLLAAAERELAAQADACLFVSAAEAALFRRRTGLRADKVGFIGNGVDLESFHPDAPVADPYPAGGGPVLVFTGAMDYWANADAANWFAREILPLVRWEAPDAQFVICGARPTETVLNLAALPGVTVTGRVEDVRGYVRHAAVSVAPLRIARGVQNKVLEAMALGRPVVCTPQVLEGIEAEPGRDLLAAAGAEPFARAVLALLTDPDSAAAMGEAARAAVAARYGWDAQLRGLDAVLEPVDAGGSQAAAPEAAA